MKKLTVTLLLTLLCMLLTSGWNYPVRGHVLLTFDDGPNPLYTPPILQTLKDNDIKAVFFVVGREVEQHPDILRQISDQGHLIGIHTYTHRNITGLSQAALQEELILTAKLISDITGQKPVYFRPPRGKYDRDQVDVIEKMGYQTVMWDAGLERAGTNDPVILVDQLVDRISFIPNPVILLHDGAPSLRHDRTPTVQALPLLIHKLREQGYGFANPREEFRFRQVEI